MDLPSEIYCLFAELLDAKSQCLLARTCKEAYASISIDKFVWWRCRGYWANSDFYKQYADHISDPTMVVTYEDDEFDFGNLSKNSLRLILCEAAKKMDIDLIREVYGLISSRHILFEIYIGRNFVTKIIDQVSKPSKKHKISVAVGMLEQTFINVFGLRDKAKWENETQEEKDFIAALLLKGETRNRTFTMNPNATPTRMTIGEFMDALNGIQGADSMTRLTDSTSSYISQGGPRMGSNITPDELYIRSITGTEDFYHFDDDSYSF